MKILRISSPANVYNPSRLNAHIIHLRISFYYTPVINGERAALLAPSFATLMEGTRKQLLEEVIEKNIKME